MDQGSFLIGLVFSQLSPNQIYYFFLFPSEWTNTWCFELCILLQPCQIMIQILKQMCMFIPITCCAHTPNLICWSPGLVFLCARLGTQKLGVTWKWRRVPYGRGGACYFTVLSNPGCRVGFSPPRTVSEHP